VRLHRALSFAYIVRFLFPSSFSAAFVFSMCTALHIHEGNEMKTTTITTRCSAFVRQVLVDHAHDRGRSLSEESRIVLEVGALAIMVASLHRPSVAAAFGDQAEQLQAQMLADLRAKVTELIPDPLPLADLVQRDGLSMN
jgi:hypothetical protein